MGTPLNPGWVLGQIPSATEWNNEFSSKVDYPATLDQGGTGGTDAPTANYKILQRGLVASSPATLSIMSVQGVRTSLSAFTLNLPPLAGLEPSDWIELYDIDYNAAAHNVTLVANGTDTISLYGSSSTSITINVSDFWMKLYVNVAGWRAIVRLS